MEHQPKTTAPQAGMPSGPLVAESALEESRQHLPDFVRTITDHLGEGIYALDTAGRVTFMNPVAERLLGWTEAELRGKDMHAIIHLQRADGTPFPREQCPLLRVMRSGEAERVEDDAFTRRDGSMVPVTWVSSPITTDGAVTGAVVAFHDITERKAADEALHRAEREAASQANQLLTVFEAMADAVIVYDVDGTILRTNAADAELLGTRWSPEIPVRTLGDRDHLFTMLDEQGRPIPSDKWPSARVLQGEVLRGASAEDILLRTADGQDIVLNASGAPVRDAAGNIIGGVLIGRDVTQRRRLEQQTREALAALMAMAEALVSGSEGGSVAPDQPGSAQTVAQRLAELTRAVMGCQRVGIITFNLETQLIHTLAVAGLTKEQEHLWAYTARLNNPPEIVQRLKLGEVVALDRTRPPYDQLPNPFGSRSMLLTPMTVGGPLLGVITIDYGSERHEFTADERAMAGAVARLVAQVIERDRLARERETARANALALVEATRRMDEFLSIAAHELKTPVTSSKLAVALASDTLASFVAQADVGQSAQAMPMTAMLTSIRGLLERTGNHMDQLSRLVVDLLDVSRIRAGKLEIRIAPCNLVTIVREVVEEQRQLTPGRVIGLRLPKASRQPPIVLADADRIRQVVANYLSNALKYSREEQQVRVHMRVDEEWARVSVRDEGPGVPAAEQRRVWERFYRVAGTQVLSGTGVGLGLGLHISRTIIEQHQGRVGLRSTPSHGATFWFALPVMMTETP